MNLRRKPAFVLVRLFGSVVAGSLLLSVASAQIYDAAKDFSIDHNPNGPWRYGSSAELDSPLEISQIAASFPGTPIAGWISSDRDVAEYRIVRDGCHRGAIPLPEASTIADVRAVRVQVFATAGTANAVPATLTRINTVFALDHRFAPGPSILQWRGAAPLSPGGAPFELPIP